MRQDPTRNDRAAFTRDLLTITRNARTEAIRRIRHALQGEKIDVEELNRVLGEINDHYMKVQFMRACERYIPNAYQSGVSWTLAYANAAPKPAGTDINIGLSFGQKDLKAIKNITTLAHNDLAGMSNDLSKKVLQIVARGDRQGLGITKISEMIGEQYNGIGAASAKRIARTSLTQAYNSAAHDRISEYAPYKEWIATLTDDRTRPSHKKIHHHVIPADEPFHLEAFKVGKTTTPAGDLMFPGDDSLGINLGQIINCRCCVGPRFTPKP